MDCRLLIDPPLSGAWNMAADEMLLKQAAETGRCCWRFYGWREPTLSLGYFQGYDERHEHTASRDCLAVRRLSGGGAILHDRELTYSLVVPAENPLAQRREQLYEIVHRSLIRVFASQGISAELCGGTDRGKPSNEPFLCFQRRAAGDVLVGRAKIAGSAQRRRRGAVLQHGSVLLERSAAAPELGSLADVSGVKVTAESLIDRWLDDLAESFGFVWDRNMLTADERRHVAALVQNRYGTATWTKRRRMACTAETQPTS